MSKSIKLTNRFIYILWEGEKDVSCVSPIGKYTIEKNDGGVSFMGISAKVVSAKNGVYKIKSSLGSFTINTKTGTIVKN